MKKIFTIILTFAATNVVAQIQDAHYTRNALSSMLVYHEEDEFGYDIYEAYNNIETSDRFDNHNIDLRYIYNGNISGVNLHKNGLYKADYGKILTTKQVQKNADQILEILNQSDCAKRLVAKWFNMTGTTLQDAKFSTKTMAERGSYSAHDIDIALAQNTIQGTALLKNMGENMLSHTFIVVNDITYVTAEERAMVAKIIFAIFGGIVDALTGGTAGADLAENVFKIADSFTGFTVRTHSYLYQLEWNDSIANTFYLQYYTDHADPQRIRNFLQDSTLFRMKYVSHAFECDTKSEFVGIYDRSDLIKMICARSMDKNIAELQHQYEPFRVKTHVKEVEMIENHPYYRTEIGMKDGVTEHSKYKVLLPVNDPQTMQTSYQYVATLRPIKDMIWDNRYNAVEEISDNSELGYTLMEKIVGGEVLSGMLLVEE